MTNMIYLCLFFCRKYLTKRGVSNFTLNKNNEKKITKIKSRKKQDKILLKFPFFIKMRPQFFVLPH